jgi:hypothetical protein
MTTTTTTTTISTPIDDATTSKLEEAVTSTTATTHLSLLETESFKITKEEFRNKLSSFIVKLLQHYSTTHAGNTNTNSEGVHLKYGRIETKEDFKYLARKLTHTILEKEMSRIASLSSSSCDLDLMLTDSKKAKAHEYVTNYMKKFPNGYSRKIDENK